MKSGSWDSIHVVEVIESENKSRATYKLTTTVMLNMVVDKPEVGETNWSGTLTRQVPPYSHQCPDVMCGISSYDAFRLGRAFKCCQRDEDPHVQRWTCD